ncbi:unnamed protein product [Albugo candida]|uniref:Uncharacterized protein n=1 Tax=Albugo candida TaxID=65357 RepID=A0A024GHS6_9STRA|nr:unnamed protein product [Albugo candida]|eukprot:CCI46071.1 unnamed protein product [Albugo candida]
MTVGTLTRRSTTRPQPLQTSCHGAMTATRLFPTTYHTAVEASKITRELVESMNKHMVSYSKARDESSGQIVALKQVKMSGDLRKEGFPVTALRKTNGLLQLRNPNNVHV